MSGLWRHREGALPRHDDQTGKSHFCSVRKICRDRLMHCVRGHRVSTSIRCMVLLSASLFASVTVGAVSPPTWWDDPNPGTDELIFKKGAAERGASEGAALQSAFEAGLDAFRRELTSDTSLWPNIHFVGADIRFNHTERDARGRWYAWVLVSYPRAQFDVALERARARAAASARRVPVFVAPLAFGRESAEQFPAVVERYRKQGYGNAVWQTIENLLYDQGFDVVTAPSSQTRDMLQDILGQFQAESSAAVKLPEKLLLINMNYFEIYTESLSRARLTRMTDFHVALMLEMYEVSAEFGNVKVPAHGEARDGNLLAATRLAAESAVNQLVERLGSR